MTVGIGAICDDGKAAILAADRAVWLETASLQFEMKTRKIRKLSPHAAMTVAGGTNDIEFVMKYCRDMAIRPASVIDLAESIQKACEEYRRQKVEDLFTRRFLGMTFAEFGKIAISSNSNITLDLFNKITAFRIDLNILVAGVDHSGAHLFFVADDGTVTHNATGFAAIGSGGSQSTVHMARLGHNPSTPLAEAIYNVYEAKKYSELARAVGGHTDIILLREGKRPKFLKDQVLSKLDEIYRSLNPSRQKPKDFDSIRQLI